MIQYFSGGKAYINNLCVLSAVSPMFKVELCEILQLKLKLNAFCGRSQCKRICYHFVYNFFIFYTV